MLHQPAGQVGVGRSPVQAVVHSLGEGEHSLEEGQHSPGPEVAERSPELVVAGHSPGLAELAGSLVVLVVQQH